MNNLMTQSFLSYVELKKQALKDIEAGPESDVESGFFPFTNAEQENLTLFFSDVEPIQAEIISITALLSDLTRLNSESKTARTRNLIRGIRDQIDSNVAAILRKAHSIKTRLATLDASNAANRVMFGANSPVDRTRTAVTNGLRTKLRELMNGFSSLRGNVTEDHKEDAENGTEMRQAMSNGVDGAYRLEIEVEERDKAVSDLKRSLSRLHQVFLDMAVMIEVQEEQLNDIEENVVKAKEYISGGTGQLAHAEGLMRRRKRWWMGFGGCLLGVVVVILICFIFRFAD